MKRLFQLIRFLKSNSDLPFLQNLKRARSKLESITYFQKQRQRKFQQILRNHNSNQNNFAEIGNLISTIQTKINNTKIQIAEQQHLNQHFKHHSSSVYEFTVKHLSIYYESVQNLVEGRREVLKDQNFKFEDGKTVKQKEQQAQKTLRFLFKRIQN